MVINKGKVKKPGRVKKSVEKYMLENLQKKYKNNDVSEVVYRLTYAGKFIIVKGKTLCGSLIIIGGAYDFFFLNKKDKDNSGHLYRHLYNHYRANLGKRFTVKIIAKKGAKTSHYDLLKREQMELDKHRNNPLCLNNAVEPYIPNYNESTGMYGWLDKMAVMSFKRYQTSKEHALYLIRYCTSPKPKL